MSRPKKEQKLPEFRLNPDLRAAFDFWVRSMYLSPGTCIRIASRSTATAL